MSDDRYKTLIQTMQNILPEEDCAQAYLIVLSGAEIGKMHRLEPGSTTIGRSREMRVCLEHEEISRLHAEILITSSGSAYIRDCGSSNGTLLNAKPLTDVQRELTDGDKIQIGGTVILKFSYQDHLEESFQLALYNSAVRDPLTGVHNKRYLNERLEQEFFYAMRHSVPMSLALFDLDHFKTVNDNFGHAAGDHVLKSFCLQVGRHTRSEELFARYGGEEFVQLMLGSTVEEARMSADRMRRLIAERYFEYGGEKIRITVSIGIASTSCEKFDSAEELLMRADEYLYQAKRRGRNRVCCFDTKKSETETSVELIEDPETDEGESSDLRKAE